MRSMARRRRVEMRCDDNVEEGELNIWIERILNTLRRLERCRCCQRGIISSRELESKEGGAEPSRAYLTCKSVKVSDRLALEVVFWTLRSPRFVCDGTSVPKAPCMTILASHSAFYISKSQLTVALQSFLLGLKVLRNSPKVTPHLENNHRMCISLPRTASPFNIAHFPQSLFLYSCLLHPAGTSE